MIHLITYGSGKQFTLSKIRLCFEAKRVGWFDTITAYGPEHLDDDFKNKFKDILTQPRGGGYWIWKPYVIKKKLKEINDGDILIYLDAGCCINPLAKKRFLEYIDMLQNNQNGIVTFENGCQEKKWTTREIFNYFNVELNSDIANTKQLVAGIRIMKKNKQLEKLIDLELQTYHENPLLVTDYYNNNNQESFFKENRHDQSIFSLIHKQHNSVVLKNETFFDEYKNFGNKRSFCYPFWAILGSKNNSAFSILEKKIKQQQQRRLLFRN